MLARILGACRYLLVVPVVGCVVLTASVVVMGVGRIFGAIADFLGGGGDFSAKAAKNLSLGVIEVIDLFLIGTVAYIAAIGIYKLFVTNEEVRILKSVKIDTLQDLEDKILGVVIAALAVAFLGQAAGGDEPTALLNYGGGIALVIAALAYSMKKGSKKED